MTDLANVKDEFYKGLALAVLCQCVMWVLIFPVGLFAGVIIRDPLLLWGNAQLLYLVPLLFRAKTQEREAFASGLCAGAIGMFIVHWCYMVSIANVQWA